MIFEAWSDFDDEVDVLSKLQPNFNEFRESKKWGERKEALEGLLGILDANSRFCTKANYGEIAGNLEQMLKRDANINVCAVAAKCITGFCKGLRKKYGPYAQSVIAVAIDKMKEKKAILRDPLTQCLDALANTVTSVETFQEEILAGMGVKNPQIKQGVDLFVYRQMNLLTADKAPKKLIKAVVSVLVTHFADADADVREASFHAAGGIQRLIGEGNLKKLFGDVTVEEAKLKKITEYAEKAAGEFAEFQKKFAVAAPQSAVASSSNTAAADSSSSNAPAAPSGAPIKEIDPFDMLDPVDVLAKLPEDFQTNIESKKWTERRDALQAFLDLITKNPKLDPKANYGEIVAQLKKMIEKDANINVAALAAKCLKGIADGLRKKFAPHAPSVVPSILEKFKEKKPVLRDPLVEAIDAVFASITLESIQDDLTAAMEKPNPNIKIQTDLFLFRAFKTLDSQSMPKKTLKALAPLLVKHTTDSDPEVRDASFAALGSAMRATGEKPFLPLLADIVEDKIKMGKVKEFYQKCLEEVGPEVVQQMVQSVHKHDAPAPAAKAPPPKQNGAPQKASRPATPVEDDENLKPAAGALPPKKNDKKPTAKPKEPEEEPIPEEPTKAPELLAINENKQQRLRDEKTLKILKWNFSTPTEEHVQQLQQLIGQEAKVSLSGNLFNRDFKMHIKAVETLLQMAETTPEALVKNSDLLLKWCTLRFFETNPAVLKVVLDLARTVLQLVKDFDEPVQGEEVSAFVPYLLVKLGEQKENFRVAVREVVEVLTDITGPVKITPILIDALKTKNSRQRAEVLAILENYIIRGGAAALKPTGIHKAIAACIADRDTGVRNAAINGLVACYREEGDQMWRNAGKLADKERAMVEERIKRTGAAPGSAQPIQATPQRGRAQVVVPASAGGTVVRRPTSRSRLPVADDVGPADTTMAMGEEPVEERTNGIRPSTSRYAIDEDFVELSGTHALNSTLIFNDVDKFVPNMPSLSSRPPAPTTPLKRSGSSSSISSIDTYDQLDKVIQNISSAIPQVAQEALESIVYMLHQPEQRPLVEERVALVSQAIAAQLNLVRRIHSLNSPTGRQLTKLAINFFNELMSKLQPVQQLLIDEQPMTDLLDAIISCLNEENGFDDQSKKSMNIIVIRFCTRCETVVFIVAVFRCLRKYLLEAPDSTIVNLYLKCLYKWIDTNTKNPRPIRLVSLLDEICSFYDAIFDKEGLQEHVRSAEVVMEAAVLSMGDAVKDALRRLKNPHNKVTGFINVCLNNVLQQNPNWKPKFEGVVAEELPKPRSARTESNAPMRRELHILVDNCVRDLGSIQAHATKLVSHLQKNPDEEAEFMAYTEKAVLGPAVRQMVADLRDGKSIPPIRDQSYVELAQRAMAVKARISKILEKRSSGVGIIPSNVLQNRDINQESFSGELPVPSNLRSLGQKTAPTEEAPKPRKGRRSIDPAVYNALQARLSEIDG